MKILYSSLVALLLAAVMTMASCGGKGQATVAAQGDADTAMTDAKLLRMSHGDGYTLVEVLNPWKQGALLHRYMLVPQGKPLPKHAPSGTTVVRTPVKRALVYSAVHTGVMAELGCQGAVKGVVDAQYFTADYVARGVRNGSIANCGSSMSPSIEKVIDMRPDAILLSPYQDANYGQISNLDIPIVECADYMEYTPLGRAEWIKFYGELLGRRAAADSIFASVKRNYKHWASVAAKAKTRPTVLTEMMIGGAWAVPGGKSYMARMLQDAGATYPWASDGNTGSLTLDFSQVLAKAQDADYWLIKWTGINSLDDLERQYKLNASFAAFKHGRVWVCDTERTRFFERFPFHPDLLLREYVAIFHPELAQGVPLTFYKRLDR